MIQIVNLKTNGGSFIQMADYGMTYSEATKEKGIIFAPWFKRSRGRLYGPEKIKDPNTGRIKINPGGIFISGSMIAKYIPDYRKYSPEQLFGIPAQVVNGKAILGKKGMISPEILKNIIEKEEPEFGICKILNFKKLN